MDLYEAIERRASVRSFQEREVDEETLRRLLQAAIKAPNAGNMQAWRFIVVASAELKTELSLAAGGQGFLAAAPVVVAVCVDVERAEKRYRDRGVHLYSIQGTAAAIENLMLAAVAEGLGSCWVGAFDEKMAAQALGCRGSLRVVAMVPLGYPAGEGYRTGRKDLPEVVEYR